MNIEGYFFVILKSVFLVRNSYSPYLTQGVTLCPLNPHTDNCQSLGVVLKPTNGSSQLVPDFQEPKEGNYTLYGSSFAKARQQTNRNCIIL